MVLIDTPLILLPETMHSLPQAQMMMKQENNIHVQYYIAIPQET